MKVAFFTSGGRLGAGHLVRAIAIGRGLRRAGFAGEYRIFGPRPAFPTVEAANLEVVDVHAESLKDPAAAAGTDLAAALARFAPDLILVDVFWAPVHFVLPGLRCECWLLIRSCPRRWLARTRHVAFDPRQFARIIGIEAFANPIVREFIDPVVVCNPDECRPRSALRERLGFPPGRRLVMVVQAGRRGECEKLCEGFAPDEIVTSNLYEPGALFPIAEWLPGADAIVCGAGYNAFWESRWLGYYERTRFTAFDRDIDDQAWRLRAGPTHVMRENGADVLARWIVGRV